MAKKKRLEKEFSLGCTGPSEKGDVDAINLMIGWDKDEESILCEFEIALTQDPNGRFAMQARVFSDAWIAFRECSEVFKILEKMNDCFRKTNFQMIKTPKPFEELVKKLEKAGWKNIGRKQSRFVRMCSECHQEVVKRRQ